MQITLNLDREARRPVVQISWFHGCRAMLDTGALFPIWVASDDLLMGLGARLIKKNVKFSGFGGDASGNLYRVNFMLDDLIYIDMPIVAKEMEKLQCHLILSATMFENTVYEIDMRNHRLKMDTKDNQPVRLLKLSNDNGKFSVYLAGTYENEQMCRSASLFQNPLHDEMDRE